MTEGARESDLPQCPDCGYRGSPIRRLSPRLYVGAIPFTLVGLMFVVAYPLSIIPLTALGYWLFIKKTCPQCKSENISASSKAADSDPATHSARVPTEAVQGATTLLPATQSRGSEKLFRKESIGLWQGSAESYFFSSSMLFQLI